MNLISAGFIQGAVLIFSVYLLGLVCLIFVVYKGIRAASEYRRVRQERKADDAIKEAIRDYSRLLGKPEA